MFVYITGSLHTEEQRMIKNILKTKNVINSDAKSKHLDLLSGHCLQSSFLNKKYI